ncbi:13475_t:CDS:2, partial [Funneliformis mosseae]
IGYPGCGKAFTVERTTNRRIPENFMMKNLFFINRHFRITLTTFRTIMTRLDIKPLP